MTLQELLERNFIALSKIQEFREKSKETFGQFTQLFHEYKNKFPYYGFIPIVIQDIEFVMFSGNDDLSAMAYFWYGPSSYERKSMALWLEMVKEADIIYDIGAYTGLYSLSASVKNPSAKVYSFEPVRRTYGRLLLNIEINRLKKRIIPINKAILNKSCSLTIKNYRGGGILDAGASVVDKGIPIFKEEELISAVSLDEFIEEVKEIPHTVKIDVEGAECLVFEGMKKNLRIKTIYYYRIMAKNL